jgi:AhpD family alkylhydroperoxidase
MIQRWVDRLLRHIERAPPQGGTQMPFFPSLPQDATTKQVFTAHPEIYSHWARVSEAILRGPSPLTPAQRELIGAYVSSLNSCQYCYGGHRAAAELFGIAPETIDGLIHTSLRLPSTAGCGQSSPS